MGRKRVGAPVSFSIHITLQHDAKLRKRAGRGKNKLSRAAVIRQILDEVL